MMSDSLLIDKKKEVQVCRLHLLYAYALFPLTGSEQERKTTA